MKKAFQYFSKGVQVTIDETIGGAQQRPLFSEKGQALISMYEQMAQKGYERSNGAYVESAFNDFELRPYREIVGKFFKEQAIESVLDYGCGGSDWYAPNFDPESGLCAVDYFNLSRACQYEPARDIDEREIVDCVVSFDVLEHIFISDVAAVLRDIFSYAKKAVVLNIACYPAAAKLPNGENAHITVRPPMWWRGVVDMIAAEFPEVTVFLLVSIGYRQTQHFPPFSGAEWQNSKNFVIPL